MAFGDLRTSSNGNLLRDHHSGSTAGPSARTFGGGAGWSRAHRPVNRGSRHFRGSSVCHLGHEPDRAPQGRRVRPALTAFLPSDFRPWIYSLGLPAAYRPCARVACAACLLLWQYRAPRPGDRALGGLVGIGLSVFRLGRRVYVPRVRAPRLGGWHWILAVSYF